MHLTFGVPYAVTTAFRAVVLAAVSESGTTWSARCRSTASPPGVASCSAGPPSSPRFALGTASGDFTVTALHLGYPASGITFAVVVMIPAAGWTFLSLNEVVAFWYADVVTRPLGASFDGHVSTSRP
jgi:uncharacterized membrane-anchored protein